MRIRPSDQASGVTIELSPAETQIPTPKTPFTLKTILAPVDFSACSNKALQYAQAIAKQFEAELILVYVMSPYMPAADSVLVDINAMLEAERDAAKKNIEELADQIDSRVGSQALLRSGQPYREIVATADETEADLIIISTHGRTGLAHTFMGSTTERVVRHAHCPVLVVREREREFLKGPLSTAKPHERRTP